MLSWIREKFGTVVIGGIITFIGFVFVFYGVFSPKSTRGLHEGAVAGTVNGDSISIGEFNREYNRRLEFFKNMMGGKVNEDQLKGFHVREMVFRELVQRKLLVQQADKDNLEASDDQVKDMIREIPAFQKDGKFDVLTYKEVLANNQQTPEGFERLVREDASASSWNQYFVRRAFVSDEEARLQFIANEDKRKIKYVLLTTEAGRKTIHVDDAAIKAYLADTAKLNVAKSRYDVAKDGPYKGKTFDAVKETIVREILAGEKLDEIQKANDRLASEVMGAMTADKTSDTKVNAMLKSVGVEVKSTDWVTRQNPYIQGIGDAAAILKDAFAKTPAKTPKKYATAAGTVVAVVIDSQSPDMAQFQGKMNQLKEQIASSKARELMQAWIQEVSKKAKIEPNPAVVSSES